MPPGAVAQSPDEFTIAAVSIDTLKLRFQKVPLLKQVLYGYWTYVSTRFLAAAGAFRLELPNRGRGYPFRNGGRK
jgi:hypothetical protein